MAFETLEKYVEQEKQWYLDHYGTLDWQWYDEGLIYAVLDYLSSCEPTDEDREYAKKELELNLDEIMNWD